MTATPSTVAICGKGRIAVSALSYTLQALAANGLQLPVVACPNADDPGYDTWYPSLRNCARMVGVELCSLRQLEARANLLLISLEFDRLIKTARFTPHGLYNIHFSRLPSYRGVYTSIWPILNGEATAGVTLHEIDDGIDTGGIIEQRTFPLPPYLTARRLYEAFMDEAFELFKSNLLRLVARDVAPTPQTEGDASYYGRGSINFGRIEIDLAGTAEEVSRFVRAFHFPEYQLPTLGGRAVTACQVIPGHRSAEPGTEVALTSRSGAFVTGDDRIVELVWA